MNREGVEVPTVPEEVADKRIELLHEHLERLLEVGYTDREFTEPKYKDKKGSFEKNFFRGRK